MKSLKYILFFLSILLFSCKDSQSNNLVDKQVIAFYYNWYGNVKNESVLDHWAHPIAPNPSIPDKEGFIDGNNGNIAANYYPQLGCYSCNDRNIIRKHMEMLVQAKIGVISVTWWGINDIKKRNLKLLFDEAEKAGIKICFHIEPFPGRNPVTVKENVEFIINEFGSHPAFYRYNGKPMYFIYDSYLIPPREWSQLLCPEGDISIRNTPYDGIFIGLNLRKKDLMDIVNGGFDGFYTYFASIGFTEATDISNWKEMQEWATRNKKLFIPSVGPGYIDTRIRPWNNSTTRDREYGKYYDRMWNEALQCKVPFISITSFNEWHEGTQIEPSIPMSCKQFKYLDYGKLGEDYYLKRTAFWVDKYASIHK